MPILVNDTPEAEGPFLAGTVIGYGTNQGDYIRIMTREQAEAMQLALSRVLESWGDA